MQASALEHGRNGMAGTGIALGIIVSVDPKKRFCEVKTFFGAPGFDDLSLSNVQWLSTNSNPDGDETTGIPRVGSTGLVFFVSGEPFIWGYFRATDPTKGAVTGKEPADLNEGDSVISTVAGNKIVVKSNGMIEITSKDTLKTIYFPKEGLLSHLCRSYSLETDSFDQKAKITDPLLLETLCTIEYRRDVGRTSLVVEEHGRVTSDVMKRVAIGPGIPGVAGVQIPVFEYTTDILGKTTVAIGAFGTGVNFAVEPNGTFSMANLFANVEMSPAGDWKIANSLASAEMTSSGDLSVKGPLGEASIKATGDIEAKNSVVTISASSSGEVSVDAPGATLKISVSGAVSLEAKGKVKIDALSGIDIESKGPVNVTSIGGKVTVKGLTIDLDGGTGPANNVLCFPLTVSQFTGSPLVPFSQTVKCSS